MKKKRMLLFLIFLFLLAGCGAKANTDSLRVNGNDTESGEIPQTNKSASENGRISEAELAAAVQTGKRSVSLTMNNNVIAIDSTKTGRAEGDYVTLQAPQLTVSNTSVPEAADKINQSWAAHTSNILLYGDELTVAANYDLSQNEEENNLFLYHYGYYESCAVMRLDTQVLSLQISQRQFTGTGGSDDKKSGMTYDISTGEMLSLRDVLLDGGLERLEEAAQEHYQQIASYFGVYEDAESEYSDASTVPADYLFFSGDDWSLTDDGLLLYLSETLLSAQGTQRVLLRYEELDGILNPAYIPQNTGYTGATILFGNRDSMPESDFTDYDTVGSASTKDDVIITTETVLPNLRVSQISWVNGQPIVEQDMYAADLMTKTDAVCIQTGNLAENPLDLRVQYTCGDETVTYYLSLDSDGRILTEGP